MNTKLYKKLCNEVIIKKLSFGGYALYGKDKNGKYTPEETSEGKWITYSSSYDAHVARRTLYFEPVINWLKAKWYVKILRFIYKLTYAIEQTRR